jgi:PTS system ascorbate-specific IIA component
MVGLLVVAHGNLGASLIDCVEYVLGRIPERLASLDLMRYKDSDAMLGVAAQQLAALDQGDGVLILTDIYGATPSNTVCRLVSEGAVEVIAGVNLPMLLKALTYRDEPLQSLAERVTQGGREGIFHVEECACHAGE